LLVFGAVGIAVGVAGGVVVVTSGVGIIRVVVVVGDDYGYGVASSWVVVVVGCVAGVERVSVAGVVVVVVIGVGVVGVAVCWRARWCCWRWCWYWCC